MIIAISILTVLGLFILFGLDKLMPGLGRVPLGAMIGLFGLGLIFVDLVLIIIEIFRVLTGAA
jgi:hypothetical protein